MLFEKIFDYDPESFLRMKKGKFFVFEKHMVFRQKDGIYAIGHFRIGELSVVDSFEQEYNHLDLTYDFSGDLGIDDIKRIRAKLILLDK